LDSAIDEYLDDNPNLTEEQAKRAVMQDMRAKAEAKKAETIISESRYREEKRELESKPYFKELEADIETMVKNTPGLTAKTAYNYLLGDRFDSLVKKENDRTRKSTIADVQDRSMRSVERSKDGEDYSEKLSKFQIKVARELGIPLKEVAKRVKR
jgi:hypothetical protein